MATGEFYKRYDDHAIDAQLFLTGIIYFRLKIPDLCFQTSYIPK